MMHGKGQHQGGQAGGHVTARTRRQMLELADMAVAGNRESLSKLRDMIADDENFTDNKP